MLRRVSRAKACRCDIRRESRKRVRGEGQLRVLIVMALGVMFEAVRSLREGPVEVAILYLLYGSGYLDYLLGFQSGGLYNKWAIVSNVQ